MLVRSKWFWQGAHMYHSASLPRKQAEDGLQQLKISLCDVLWKQQSTPVLLPASLSLCTPVLLLSWGQHRCSVSLCTCHHTAPGTFATPLRSGPWMLDCHEFSLSPSLLKTHEELCLSTFEADMKCNLCFALGVCYFCKVALRCLAFGGGAYFWWFLTMCRCWADRIHNNVSSLH